MDDSLSAIFMDGCLPSLPISWDEAGATNEELTHLLRCASMELESARKAAKAQGQLHEARVRHLEELLKTTRRERDEARDECLKLHERLGSCCKGNCAGLAEAALRHESPVRESPGGDSLMAERDSLSCNFMQASMAASSSGGHFQMNSASSMQEVARATFSDMDWKLADLQELEQQLNFEPHHHLEMEMKQQQQSSSPSLQIDQPGQQMQMQGDDSLRNLHCNLAMVSPTEDARLASNPLPMLDDSHQFDLGIHEDLPVSSVDLRQSQQNDHQAWPLVLSKSSLVVPTLGCQASFSSMSSPQQFQASGMCSPPSSVALSNHLFSPVLQRGSAVASLLTPLERASAYPPKAMHLPEPPEADLQVMLNSLPEKGKLLQAVMQAGPLLQTLLLAGPLPQWRHPPPALDSVEIPKVSMTSSSPGVPLSSVPQTALCNLVPNHGHTSSLDYVSNVSPMASSRHSSPIAAMTPRNGSPISTLQSPSATFCSTSRLVRSPLHSHTGQDLLLTGAPLKYAKIH